MQKIQYISVIGILIKIVLKNRVDFNPKNHLDIHMKIQEILNKKVFGEERMVMALLS